MQENKPFVIESIKALIHQIFDYTLRTEVYGHAQAVFIEDSHIILTEISMFEMKIDNSDL